MPLEWPTSGLGELLDPAVGSIHDEDLPERVDGDVRRAVISKCPRSGAAHAPLVQEKAAVRKDLDSALPLSATNSCPRRPRRSRAG